MGEDEVLDTNLLMEGSGISTILNAVEYLKVIEGDHELLFPTRKDFILSVEMAGKLLGKGTPLPAVDIIIAAMCLNRGYVLRTKDAHFEAVRALPRSEGSS